MFGKRIFWIALLLPLNGVITSEEEADRSSSTPPRDAQLILSEVYTLIDEHSLIMDHSTYQDKHNFILTKFRSCLSDLTIINDSSFMDALTNEIIRNIYKMRGYAIKYMLSSGEDLTIGHDTLLLPWSTDLLIELLKFRNATVKWEEYEGGGACDKVGVAESGVAMCSLDLAVKLGMLDILKLLVNERGRVCATFEPLQCASVLHYATVNQDTSTIDYIMEHIRTELVASEETNGRVILCRLLTREHQSFGRSPLDIAHHKCSHGARCDTFDHLLTLVRAYCGEDWNLSHPPISHTHLPTCSANLHHHHHDSVQHFHDFSLKEKFHVCMWEGRGCKFGAWTGQWRTYGQHKVGRVGCDLPRVSAESVTPLEFERNFVNMSVPVVITGLTRKWLLVREWTRDSLSQHWADVDLLVGSIPYGEVFGERFGYATVREFLRYMDGYAQEASLEVAESADFKAPLYVFDGKLLHSHFKGLYDIGDFNISLWRSVAQYPQFILGPAGSGAPFHFHCHALNALIHGRKKWFLFPPSSALYSKQHPLLWYNTQYSSMQTKPIECVQGPGEVLYVPSRWAHSTVNLDECVGLAIELDTGDC